MAHDTASEMVAEEGGEGLMECGSWYDAVKNPKLKEVILKEKAPPGYSEETMHKIKASLRKAHPNWSTGKITGVAFATAWKNYYKKNGAKQESVDKINEVDDSKLTAMERKKINATISARGELSGNIRYKQHGGKSKALALLTNILDGLGYKLHMVSGDEILGDKGNKRLSFSRANGVEISNSFIIFNYENLGDMENPNFEITVYAS